MVFVAGESLITLDPTMVCLVVSSWFGAQIAPNQVQKKTMAALFIHTMVTSPVPPCQTPNTVTHARVTALDRSLFDASILYTAQALPIRLRSVAKSGPFHANPEEIRSANVCPAVATSKLNLSRRAVRRSADCCCDLCDR